MRNLLEIIRTEKIELVSLSHALYNTGAILAVEEAGEILNAENIPFFVDAAQSVGCLEKVNVGKIGCNFMSFNGSKWLCGPMGTGIFYCSRKASEMLEPLGIGGESAPYTMITASQRLHSKECLRNFKQDSVIMNCWSELFAQMAHDYGFENIRKKISYVADILREGLAPSAWRNVSGTNGSDSAESGPIWLYLVKNSLTALMLATGMGETEALFRYALAPHANSGTFILLPPAIYDIVRCL